MPNPSVSVELLYKYIKENNGATELQIKDFCAQNKLFFGIGESVGGVLLEYKSLGKLTFDKKTQKYFLSK